MTNIKLINLLKDVKSILSSKTLSGRFVLVANRAGVSLDRVCNFANGRTKCRHNGLYNPQQRRDLELIRESAMHFIEALK